MKHSNLDDLQLFVALVEAGSFTIAAKKLNMAKSKISRRLVQLEQQLGVELLIRTTRNKQLTESGRLLFCSCKTHIDALSQAQEELSSLLHEPQGKLNILLPLEFFNQVIGTLISDFCLLYPKIQLNCQHYSGAVPEFTPEFDLSFVLHEQDLPPSNWIGKELLSFSQSIYYAALDNNDGNSCLANLLKQKIIKPEHLSGCECILSEPNQPWLFRDKQKVQTVNVKGRVILASPEMRLQASQQGIGLSKLPDYLLHQVQGEKLHKLHLNNPVVAQRLSVLYQSRNIPIKTRTFLDYFQSNIGQLI
ncbi:LysR family transcriptional regulator [Colwellia sp. D2M02]|uniref:LysR family transcriptional regulator n=1 Tax=Colwellia sp. D2M02 TaxID=2841562 RepID=UPI001C084164|nr:LysR family transcriptional regulator [Colwellia sp. D2M02]MBU2893092.1 LysR family transcriptional regulator [Colwellia sp. D2M02]